MRRKLGGILVVALVLRCVVAVGLTRHVSQRDRDFLIPGDANGYWALAQKIANGQEYAIHEPPRRILRMPGLPLVLAGSQSVFGNSTGAARLVLAVVGTIGCGLVFWLGRELANDRIGLVAAGIVAVAPPLVGFSPVILSETLFATTMVASLILLARLQRVFTRNPKPIAAHIAFGIVAGISVGLACYARPIWILMAPGMAIVLLVWGPQTARVRALGVGAAVMGGCLLCLLPWTIRNYRVTGGQIVVTTLWLGPSLYDGLNPEADGDSDMTFVDRDGVYQRLSEYDADREYRRRAWAFVRENPWQTVLLGGRKLARFWKPWPNADQFRHPALQFPLALYFGFLLLFAAFGLWQRRDDVRLWLFSAGPILYFSALHTIFVGSIRYRLPAEYSLSVLAAIGLSEIWGTRPPWSQKFPPSGD